MDRLFLATALAVSVAAQAQTADPLRSAECGLSRDRLEQALEDASAKKPGAAGRLAAVRKEAIAACLGGESPGRERKGAPEPVVRVAPVTALPRGPLPAPATPATPSVVSPRPSTITGCDPGGCWDSEGRRLNAQGPVLVGPRGACMVQGAVVLCP